MSGKKSRFSLSFVFSKCYTRPKRNRIPGKNPSHDVFIALHEIRGKVHLAIEHLRDPLVYQAERTQKHEPPCYPQENTDFCVMESVDPCVPKGCSMTLLRHTATVHTWLINCRQLASGTFLSVLLCPRRIQIFCFQIICHVVLPGRQTGNHSKYLGGQRRASKRQPLERKRSAKGKQPTSHRLRVGKSGGQPGPNQFCVEDNLGETPTIRSETSMGYCTVATSGVPHYF